MRTPAVLVAAALAATALPALLPPGRSAAQTKIVTPPGSTTRVTTTPSGDQIITVTVNSKPVPFEQNRRPRMMSGRVMVPLRGVIERLGGNVLWDPNERVVTGAHPGTNHQFRIRAGSNEALVNGNKTALDAPPVIANGTTYVPLRFVSEALGAKVTWDNARRAVLITAGGASTTVER